MRCCSLGSPPMLRHVVALLRIVEIRKARVVELQIGAAALAELRDLARIDGGEITPEIFHAWIDRLVDGGTPTAVVHHAGRRNRELRRAALHHRFQEIEVIAEDAAVERQLAFHLEARGREVHIALVAVKMHGDVLLNLAHTADLVQKVHVPRRAAEFAVGDALQAQLFLHTNDVANRGVFGLAQAGGIEPPCLVLRARAGELGRPQQAADMVGAEWRLSQRHSCLFQFVERAVTRQHLRHARIRFAALADGGE